MGRLFSRMPGKFKSAACLAGRIVKLIRKISLTPLMTSRNWLELILARLIIEFNYVK